MSNPLSSFVLSVIGSLIAMAIWEAVAAAFRSECEVGEAGGRPSLLRRARPGARVVDALRCVMCDEASANPDGAHAHRCHRRSAGGRTCPSSPTIMLHLKLKVLGKCGSSGKCGWTSWCASTVFGGWGSVGHAGAIAA